MNKFYITTAIDYTNDVIHIGHAYQKILADSLARYHRLLGDQTHFLTGTDEYGQKNEKSAKSRGIDPQEFVDEISAKDKKQWKNLNISYDRFIRTTDKDHKKFAQEFYLKSKAAGDIYLNKYEGLYCEGCEAYYEKKDLVNGKCPFHPSKEIQHLTEENYFFRLSKYQDWLEKYILEHPEFVWPDKKREEILSFIRGGLKDFSVSRLKKNLSWGIPVPDDPNHVIYVWFDALINYLTYGVEENCWPADVHVLGKDNQRFHAIYWPAMLKSAGYQLPKTILVHDFYSLGGQRISKSLGNVILPSDLTKKYTTDGVRYFFLRYGPLTNDVDITWEKLKEVYNADLANGLGNLVARVAKLAEKVDLHLEPRTYNLEPEVISHLNGFRVDLALEFIWQKITAADALIDSNEPWKLEGEKLTEFLQKIIPQICQIAYNLQPFLPETAQKIQQQFSGKIKSGDPLFPRIS
ncbi:MAG: methionine--tRNA ligase [Patescibacteria group bacterium]|nr:methionine--tRNA ligase [Patescibacteria group bacterium]MCL5432426.1 methionine--tRNA ligase [Patescibacteria group bacterium]